jgi:thimet oligopeptidase
MTVPKQLVLKTPEEVLRASDAEITRARKILDGILKEPGPRTVENTFIPYNELLRTVSEVSLQCQLLFNVHAQAAVRDAANGAYLAADSFATELSLNRPLYNAFKAMDVSKEDEETKYAVWKTMRDFHRAGVDQDEAAREKIKTLNDEISEIGTAFDRNINEDVRTITVDKQEHLAGLPPDYIAAHPVKDGRITINTTYPDSLPIFQYAKNDDVRHRLRKEFDDRGYSKNLEILQHLIEKRYELARILGYENYAAYVMEDKMIGSAKAAEEFVKKISTAADARTRQDYTLLLERKKEDSPAAVKLEPWDTSYYIERLRAERHAFDSQEVRQYLQFEKVRDGIFNISGKLFGLHYKRLNDVPVWNESVEVYDVYEGHKRLGRFYLDLHPREGKFNHAAEFTVVVGLKGIQLPQAALVCNFPDPRKSAGPALMEHSEVVTFFHEFGHLLHVILSGHSRWLTTSVEKIEFDFIEAPSQLLEEWAYQPESLRQFAKHPVTGETISEEIIERMEHAEAVARGLLVRRQVFFAALSLRYYNCDPTGIDTTSVAKELSEAYYLIPWHEGTHFQCNFGHLNGYSAAYYTYMWSLVIAKDLFSRFQDSKSIFNRDTAELYRRAVFDSASMRSAKAMVKEFLGRDVRFNSFDAWLKEGSAS